MLKSLGVGTEILADVLRDWYASQICSVEEALTSSPSPSHFVLRLYQDNLEAISHFSVREFHGFLDFLFNVGLFEPRLDMEKFNYIGKFRKRVGNFYYSGSKVSASGILLRCLSIKAKTGS